MSAYLFTYHAHGSWLPDHPRGYVHRTQGLQPSNLDMAANYRRKQTTDAVEFDTAIQQSIIETARGVGAHLDCTTHTVFTDPTHAHVLVSWDHDRPWNSMRTSIRSALSRKLNDRFDKRDWFSDSPSRRRVKDHDHFDYLLLVYALKHTTVWRNPASVSAAESRDAQRAVPVTQRRKRRS